MDEEIKRDDRVFLIGEEVAQYDGAFRRDCGRNMGTIESLTHLLQSKASQDRCRALIAGTGDFVIHDIQLLHASYRSDDQLCCKDLLYVSRKVPCPIVFRGANGAAAGVAAQHSQDFSAWYAHCPGLKVLAPYSSEDAKGLLKAAIRDDNPVVFLENEILYGHSFPVTEEMQKEDFVLPIGKCKIERPGDHITIVSFSKGVELSLAAAKELEAMGVSAEVINLRSLRPLDFDTIQKSVMKTNHLVTVEQGWPMSRICAQVNESPAWDYLDAPILRVTGVDVPMPFAHHLEDACLPRAPQIVAACKKSLNIK
ncbi:pyruvate dehydrogenase E1 component subunit beta family protein [Ostertagia ostertagi]